MSRWRVVGLLGMLACLNLLAINFSMAASSSRGPGGCPVGSGLSEKEWICLTIQEGADVRLREIDLREALTIAKVRARRFGCVVGVGGGVSAVVTPEWDVETAPAAHVGVTCGLRF